jgi:signal recognition particle-docking protein ftsY
MAEEKKGFFSRLVAGLEKTRKAVVYGLDDLFNGPGEVDDEFFDELEEILITGDVGVRATEEILEELREAVEAQHVRARSACRDLLIDSIKSRMDLGENAYDFEKQPSVLLLIGVNGVGKTTTAGKMAAQAKANGKRVLLAGADTFRAAAIEQLEAWSQRAGVEMVKSSAGADPAAVVFDACQAARARRTDLLICDTAGRLHNKKNLMEELRKIDRVLQRELPDYCRETLLVLDGTTGQNAIEQAKEFGDICEISGVALTKLDGSAKGGVAIAIQAELKLPVKFIGVGEKIDDLRKFDAAQYVEALFARDTDSESEEEAESSWNQ